MIRIKNIKILLSIALVLIIVFVAYFPCLKNGFVDWDDDAYVTQNPTVHALSLSNIKKIFFSFASDRVGLYLPVTLSTFLLEFHFFKLNPFVYHLTNLILHLFNCALVFWLILMLSGKAPVALLAALLFGIHPLQVESVAWITERKNVLYGLFYLGAMLSYLHYLKTERSLKYYCFSLSLFLLSLLSKAMAVTLPFALLLIDYVWRRKKDKMIFVEKIPFFFLSAVFGVIAIIGVHSAGGIRQQDLYDIVKICMFGSYGIVFYLFKLFFPFNLSCLYPYEGIKDAAVYVSYMAIVICLFLGILRSARFTRKIVFGSGLFLAALFPALQFIPNGPIIVADRYIYIPVIGLFYVVAEMVVSLYARQMKYTHALRFLLSFFLVGTISALAFLTWNRCHVWHDGISLWSDVLKKYPNSTTAYNNRGVALLLRGEYEKAHADFNRAMGTSLQYKGDDEGRLYYTINLSNLYNSNGQHDKAIVLLENAIKANPKNEFKYYGNLAVSYAEVGKTEQAISLLEKSIRDNPDDTSRVYYNLGLIYKNTGNRDKAMVLLSKSIAADPGFAAAYYSLGIMYHDAGQIPKAILCYKKAIQMDSKNEKAYNNLATAYMHTNKYREAIAYSKKAIRINSRYTEAYINLGNSYCAVGNNKDAIAVLIKALELNPGLGVTHNNLAAAYYYSGQYDLALRHCDKAVAMGYKVEPKFLEWLKPYRKEK